MRVFFTRLLAVVLFFAIMVACPYIGKILTGEPSFLMGLMAIVLTPPVNVLAWFMTFGLWQSVD